MAVVQLRNPTKGRANFDRKKANGKSSNEAMRCLKRRLSDAVYRVPIDGSGRATGQRLCLQRDRFTAQHRLFGQATSRTRHTQA